MVLQVANEVIEELNLKPEDVFLGQGKQDNAVSVPL